MTLNDGFLIVNKPLGLTSKQLVDRVKRHTHKKIGHTGTLDPLATGMMVLSIGDATKFSRWVISQDKAYKATVTFGTQTTTDDLEGDVLHQSNHIPSKQDIEKTIPSFIGTIAQVPPQYSAIHINGRRAHQLARKNQTVDIPPRNITIHKIDILSHQTNQVELYIHCQSGTYIRSIARDLGQALNSYAHLSSLHRLWVSPFQDLTPHELSDLPQPTISLDEFFKDQPSCHLTKTQALDLAFGKPIHLENSGTLSAYYNNTFLGIITGEKTFTSIKLRANVLDWIMLQKKDSN